MGGGANESSKVNDGARRADLRSATARRSLHQRRAAAPRSRFCSWTRRPCS